VKNVGRAIQASQGEHEMSEGEREGAWRIHVDGERSNILEDIRRMRHCGLVAAWVPLSACWRSGRSGDHVSDYHPTASPSTSVYIPHTALATTWPSGTLSLGFERG